MKSFREELHSIWDVLDKAADGVLDVLPVGHEGCSITCEATTPHYEVNRD